MKTWIKLLVAAVAVLVLAAADEVKGQACDIDAPGVTRKQVMRSAEQRFTTCLRAGLNDETMTEMKDPKSIADVRRFASAFCANTAPVASCLATVKTSYETCHNKNEAVPVTVFVDIFEHLLPGACENDGEHFAHLVHGFLQLTHSSDNMIPLRRCAVKENALYQFVQNYEDLDLVSRTYFLYKNIQNMNKCMKHVEDDAYKPALEWLSNMLLSTLKCRHHEEDRLVPCKDLDVSKVPTTSICAMAPLNATNQYDYLEETVIGCYTIPFTHDTEENNSVSLDDLNKEFKELCAYHRNVPHCLLMHSGYAEMCLTEEENKQFQLFAQSIEDFTERSCVEEGSSIANVMHELYHQMPEHVKTLRECYGSDLEASKTHHGHAVSNNMRFYHEVLAFKQCAMDKLPSDNDVIKGIENVFNDVLKKMKCVSPEDGNAVLCETIHEH